MTASIISFGSAFPAYRLPTSAYAAAWGSNAARGLQRKPFCGFDEDPISLAIAAGRLAVSRLSQVPHISALYLGATTLPYEEKPASATVVTALFEHRAIRTVELRGSCQAGLQALILAAEYCAAHPGSYAMAIATDAPQAAADSTSDHAFAAGAAAFIVGPGPGLAEIGESAAATIETFGSRFRRNGERYISDLELRVSDTRKALAALKTAAAGADIKHLATGGPPDLSAAAQKSLGGDGDGLWPQLGDVGAAAAAVALAHVLEIAGIGETILAAAIGSGVTAVAVRRTDGVPLAPAPTVRQQLSAGIEVDYITYLKHRRMLATAGTATS